MTGLRITNYSLKKVRVTFSMIDSELSDGTTKVLDNRWPIQHHRHHEQSDVFSQYVDQSSTRQQPNNNKSWKLAGDPLGPSRTKYRGHSLQQVGNDAPISAKAVSLFSRRFETPSNQPQKGSTPRKGTRAQLLIVVFQHKIKAPTFIQVLP